HDVNNYDDEEGDEEAEKESSKKQKFNEDEIGDFNKSHTVEDIKEHTNYLEFKEDENDPMGFYVKYPKKNYIISSNKLKVANLYREFFRLEAVIPRQIDPSIGIEEGAPFYDPNSGVKKLKYYENIKNYLSEQSSSQILDSFDSSKINGAINLKLNQEEQTANKIKFLKGKKYYNNICKIKYDEEKCHLVRTSNKTGCFNIDENKYNEIQQ
ncbi:14680_t:CDS:2, partial [Racocetra fulgida]